MLALAGSNAGNRCEWRCQPSTVWCSQLGMPRAADLKMFRCTPLWYEALPCSSNELVKVEVLVSATAASAAATTRGSGRRGHVAAGSRTACSIATRSCTLTAWWWTTSLDLEYLYHILASE